MFKVMSFCLHACKQGLLNYRILAGCPILWIVEFYGYIWSFVLGPKFGFEPNPIKPKNLRYLFLKNHIFSISNLEIFFSSQTCWISYLLFYICVHVYVHICVGRCGGRYDPQLVKRSSEWVSEWVYMYMKMYHRHYNILYIFIYMHTYTFIAITV